MISSKHYSRLVQGKLYLCFWLSLSHAAVQSNSEIQSFLQALKTLTVDQEMKGSYKSALTVADFILNGDSNFCEMLICLAAFSFKWSVTVPLWRLLPAPLKGLFERISAVCAFSDLDLSFRSASDLGADSFPTICSLSRLLSTLIANIREPLESSPALMKQISTSLEFYEPKVKFVARIRSLGVEAGCELPNLLHFLHHRKAFPFL